MTLLIKTIFFKQTKIVKKTAFARNYLYKPPHPQLILSLRKERNVIICREEEYSIKKQSNNTTNIIYTFCVTTLFVLFL